MMTHTSGNVFGLFREDTENYRGTTGGQLLGQDDYEKDPRRGDINSAQWLIANALKPNDLLGIANSRIDLFGGELHKFMRTALHHLTTMTFVGESLPNPGNRLTLSRERDLFGVPIAQVTHAFGPEDILCFDAGMKQGTDIFKAAGAYDAWPSGRVKMHTMSGAIMGRDPSKSVTNSFGQLHDIPNLFVAGPSLYPTCAAVNPNFTIHATTLQSARFILDNWTSLT